MNVIYELCTPEERDAQSPAPRWFCWLSCGKCKKRFDTTLTSKKMHRLTKCPFCCDELAYGMREEQRKAIYLATDGALGQRPNTSDISESTRKGVKSE